MHAYTKSLPPTNSYLIYIIAHISVYDTIILDIQVPKHWTDMS